MQALGSNYPRALLDKQREVEQQYIRSNGTRRIPPERRGARVAMALAALSGDEQLVIFSRLCNVLDPGVAVAFGSASSELRELTQAPRQQLQADYEAAAALGCKAGMLTC